MGIKNMTTAEAADILCRLIDPMERIGRDPVFCEQLREKSHSVGQKTRLESALDAASLLIPLLLERHRDDFFEILAIVTEKPVEVIEMQPVRVSVDEIRKCVQDGIVSFFPSSGC